MTSRYRPAHPLVDLERSQQDEILRYKWIESEKAGVDIGWDRAAAEWLDRHFPAWKQNNWNRAVDEADRHKPGHA